MSLPADQRTRSCAKELVCPDCGISLPLSETTFRCPDCDKGLDVVYDYELAKQRIAELGPEQRPLNVWRYEELLPIVDRNASSGSAPSPA
jgi:threonine synthase